ncbi:hypothetical protein NDU88_002391 [Pleurodeles waltl]|uniref:Uncharacterized protein n=1 Tax=Pleurodeles waltl TaxID=8319 RepID=A0AAV7Q9R4_PLEWA|nr:hypothetical protein NDU88_002391 [Pleurodeles waltl]
MAVGVSPPRHPILHCCGVLGDDLQLECCLLQIAAHLGLVCEAAGDRLGRCPMPPLACGGLLVAGTGAWTAYLPGGSSAVQALHPAARRVGSGCCQGPRGLKDVCVLSVLGPSPKDSRFELRMTTKGRLRAPVTRSITEERDGTARQVRLCPPSPIQATLDKILGAIEDTKTTLQRETM